MNIELESEVRVILSVDIVGSTALYETVGDARARAIIAECLAAMKRFCAQHEGDTLAEVGDQIIAVFDDATGAASAASEIHLYMHERPVQGADSPVHVRIGLHAGAVPASGDILSSETVKIANWAATNAKPEQTLATRFLIDRLPRIFRSVSRYVDDETWNFMTLEHLELYEIIWDVEAITAYTGEKNPRDDNNYDRVVFSYHSQKVSVDASRPVASIGRDHNNDLVIDRDLVSRQHLAAQFSRGRCTITDNSTNGSLIRLTDGQNFQIKRESFRLSGSGVIIPGRPEKSVADYEIRFHCG